MPISAQRRARRLPFWWTIDMTGMVASHAAMVVMVPALAEDGDIIKQRTFALRIAYRGVLTDTLPVRTALGPYPTRAFDLSSGPVMSVLSDGELSTSHAWLNNPSREGQGAIPRKWGLGDGPVPCSRPIRRIFTVCAGAARQPSQVQRLRASACGAIARIWGQFWKPHC